MRSSGARCGARTARCRRRRGQRLCGRRPGKTMMIEEANGRFADRGKYRRALLKRWLFLWVIAAALVAYPINNLPIRIGLLLSVAGLWGGLLYFYWRVKTIRFGALAVAGVIFLFLILPGKERDASRLRETYVESLRKYEGTRYIWGGENRLGIDCSGLVRKGLIIANYKQGIWSLNPALVREGLSLWWHDCSARALGEGYRQRTHLLFSADSINQIDPAKMLPGDIAVTESGVHTLAYLGDRTWIEADPVAGRVLQVQTPSKSPWFNEPVKVMRWAQLDERPAEQ